MNQQEQLHSEYLLSKPNTFNSAYKCNHKYHLKHSNRITTDNFLKIDQTPYFFRLFCKQIFFLKVFMGVGGLPPFIIVNLTSYFLDNFL